MPARRLAIGAAVAAQIAIAAAHQENAPTPARLGVVTVAGGRIPM
jgi:hypothetical protein